MLDKKLYSFSGNIKGYVAKTTFLSCCRLIGGILFSFIFAYLLKDILENIREKDFDFNYATIFTIIILVVIIKQLCTKKVASMFGDFVIEIKKNLRTAIFEKALRLGLTYSQIFKTQELIHLSVDNVEQLETYFGGCLVQFFYCIISSIVLFLAVAPFSLKVALILLAFALFIPTFLYVSLGQVRKVQKKYFAKYMNVGTLFLDSLQGLTTLKIYGTDKDREIEIEKMSEEFRTETMRVLKMQLFSIAIINWIIYAGTVLAIIYEIKAYSNGDLSLFGLLFIFMLAPEFFIPMRTLTALFHVAMTGVSAAENIMRFLNFPEKNNSGTLNFPEKTSLKADDLSFAYPDGTKALHNINIDIDSAGLYGIVGHSGCGKSTFASIVTGELTVEKNNIFIDKTDITDIKVEERPKNILKITHDAHIFSLTLRENLTMGNKNISDEKMIEVLKLVKLWKIFEKLDGLDTKLESQGKNLSGGQAQRVSLARCILYDAQIYIFDEATSNIDIESEKIILEIIHKLAEEKIVLYISHRLSAVKNAKEIYVFSSGKIVQQGTHAKMYAQENSLYQEMYKNQEELENYLVSKRGDNNE